MEQQVNIENIKNIHPPTSEEFHALNLEQIEEWLERLHPYYYRRSEILQEFGMDEWKKVIIWPAFYMRANKLRGK